jgi:tetratricopeptide (TPR) repeat protein
MKAEHRKELETNTLAKTLGQTLQGLKEGPSRGTVLILVLIGLAALLIFTWRYFARSSQEADSTLWYQWDNLAAPDQLDSFLKNKDAQDSTQGRLGRFLAARRALHDGLRDLGQLQQHTKALDDLKKASELYGKLIDETGRTPLLNQEALRGAAQAAESLGEYDRAKDLYGQLAQKYKDTVHGKNAQKQLERLNNEANKNDLQELKSRLVTVPTGTP